MVSQGNVGETGFPGLLVGTTTPETALVLMVDQLRAFKDAGFRVELVSSPGPALRSVGDREGVAVHAIPLKRQLSPLSDLVALGRALRLIRKLDISVSYIGTPKAGLILGIAAVLARVPRRVYLLRGLRLESERGFRRAVLWLCEWFSVHAAHEVIAVSESLLAEAKSLGLLKRRAAYVVAKGSSNGVSVSPVGDRASVASGGRLLRAREGLKVDDFVFGFAGRITLDKGIEQLVAAFKVVRDYRSDVRLLVAGAADDVDGCERLSRLIDRCEGAVRLGFVSDMAMFYNAIDCLVLPTVREGFPNVVLEAAAEATPAITTRATGAVDSVVPYVTGLLVPVGSVEELANAMRFLAKNPETAAEMGRAAKSRVSTDFRREDLHRELVASLKRNASLAK